MTWTIFEDKELLNGSPIYGELVEPKVNTPENWRTQMKQFISQAVALVMALIAMALLAAAFG